MRPKVSVIIPVFNGQDYIERCINSIVSQTLEDIEIVIIDDGSTDDSAKIIKEYKMQDKRIKLFSQRNSGVSNARNRGIMESTGVYITFVDGDDFILKNMLEMMYHTITENNVSIVFCDLEETLINRSLQAEHNANIQPKIMDRVDYLNKMLQGYYKRTACGLMVQKEYLMDYSLKFDSSLVYGEDFLFTVSMLIKSGKIALLEIPFYRIVERQNSASRKPDLGNYEKIIQIEQKLTSILSDSGDVDVFNDSVALYIQNETFNSISKIILSSAKFYLKISALNELKKSKLAYNYIYPLILGKSKTRSKIKAVLFKTVPSAIIVLVYSRRLKYINGVKNIETN